MGGRREVRVPCAVLTALLFSGVLNVQGAEPAVTVPFDGSARALLASGDVFDGIIHGRAIFAAGVAAQGLKVQRHAYDQVTAVQFEGLPFTGVREGTLAFWLNPSWEGLDGERHSLFSLSSGDGFRAYLVKNPAGLFDYSVCAPKQNQILSKCEFAADRWCHIAVTWDLARNRTALYLDGELVSSAGHARGPFVVPAGAATVDLWLGSRSSDRFSAVVGDAVYDELKLFDVALSAADVRALLLDAGMGEEATVVDLSNATLPSGTVNGLAAADVALFKRSHTDAVTVLDPAAAAVSFSCWFSLKDREYTTPTAFLSLAGDVELAMGTTGAGGQLAVKLGGKAFVSRYALAFDERHHVAVNITPKAWLELYIDGALQLSRPCAMAALGSITELRLGGTIADVTNILATCRPLSQAFLRACVKDVVPEAAASSLETRLWDVADAHTEVYGSRSRICLNGMWRVKPAPGYSMVPPEGAWGLIRVPGSYRSPLYEIYLEEAGALKEQDWAWQGKPLHDYRAGWYQRTFSTPKDSNGRHVFLNFTNVVANYARITVNGQLVDAPVSGSPYFTAIPDRRRIDVTHLLKSTNTVTVFIERQWNLWRGQPSINDHHEIALDDVWLETGPSPVQLLSTVVFPSFRQRSITLQLRLANPEGRRGAAQATASYSLRGMAAKQDRHPVTLSGEREQVVALSSAWETPEFWDLEHPRLYELRVDLHDGHGMLLDTAPRVVFGFREFWVENGEFYLNGKVTRLRLWSSPGIYRMRPYYGTGTGMKQWLAKLKDVGYNGTRCNPVRGRESQVGWETKFAESDRVGFYHLQSTPPYEGVVSLEDYRRHIERFVEAFGNHPSILMWYCDFNTCSYAWNQDPAKLNDTDYVPAHKTRQRAVALQARQTIRQVDPTREVFHHAGGNFGKIFGSMNYQSMGVPLQEQEDWPEQWARAHTQPLMTIECDFPFWNQFLHFDLEPSRGTAAQRGEKSGLVYLVNEHAARYFGDAAFRRVRLPESPVDLGHSRRWHSSMFSPRPENFTHTKALLTERIVKAWRGYGVSAIGHFPCGRGQRELYQSFRHMNMVYEIRNDIKKPGLRPDRSSSGFEVHRHALVDYTKPLPLLASHQRAFAPLLVFLGGRPDDFTNRDHAFYAGEQVIKSIVVVNDLTTDAELLLDWTLTRDGDSREIAGERGSHVVEAGAIAKLPLEFAAPEAFERTPCTLQLKAIRDGRVLVQDAMKLEFFPAHSPATCRDTAVAVYDPVGQTKALLNTAGLPYTDLRELADAAGKRLVIVGKHALGAEPPEVLRQLDASGMIENGLKLIVFEQKQCNLGNLVFERSSQRIAFVRTPDHPVVEGLTSADFRDWRGDSDTVPDYVVADEFSPHYPRDKWKCGNSGMVAGYVIRKPEYGNITPIVDCGFNLRHTPLLELRRERGVVVCCQLDVTGRYGVDPVATQVVDSLLAYMVSPLVPLRHLDTLYVGGEGDKAWLERAGVLFRPAAQLDGQYLRSAHVLICGAGSTEAMAANREDVLAFIRFGGGVFLMPGADTSWLPMGLGTEVRDVFRALLPQREDPLLRAIANADLYFREPRPMPVVTGGPAWAVKTDPAVILKADHGNGAIVVCTLDPNTIDGLWNQEKATRVLCRLLTNMHVGLGRGYRFFQSSTYRHNQLSAPGTDSKTASARAGAAGPDPATPDIGVPSDPLPVSWSPYIDELDFYDVDAFHNW